MKRLELKQKALPILKLGSCSSSGYNITLGIKNEGNRAKITNLVILNGEVNFSQSHSFPLMLESNYPVRFGLSTKNRLAPTAIELTCEIFYEDSIGTRYSIKIMGKWPTIAMSEPIEL